MMKRVFGLVFLLSMIFQINFVPTAHAYTGAFLSFPKQSAPQSYSGSNLEISNKTFQGFPTSVCLTVHNAVNVYIHDIDLDACGGGIYLVDVTGDVQIRRIRARNIGDGTIGSGHSNVIQLSRTTTNRTDDGVADIQSVKVYGGDTEDVISVYKSGGTDSSHPLVLGDIHVEHPLPPSSLAWSSGSGTCINLADAGGHDIRLQNSTFLNCGQVGIQMNQPLRVTVKNNVVYGAQRSGSNVGLSQYGTCTCSGDKLVNNRAYWKNASGSNNSEYIQHKEYFTDWQTGNVLNDTTIDPAKLHVVL